MLLYQYPRSRTNRIRRLGGVYGGPKRTTKLIMKGSYQFDALAGLHVKLDIERKCFVGSQRSSRFAAIVGVDPGLSDPGRARVGVGADRLSLINLCSASFEIRRANVIYRSNLREFPIVQIDSSLAERANGHKIMTDKQNRPSVPSRNVLHFSNAFSLEIHVAYGENLIHD